MLSTLANIIRTGSLRTGNLKFTLNAWTVSSFLITLLICIPLIFIIVSLFYPAGESWSHFTEHLLFLYITNTLILLTGTAVLSIVLGVSTAWFVSVYDFPGKRIFEWALILPLALPAYIAAFSYTGFFDSTGPLFSFGHWISGGRIDLSIQMMNLPGLILIYSFVLFPYVYLISRASFLQQASVYLEISRSLGQSSRNTFLKVVLPLARPAIIGGVVLVLMEVLNDYGAVKYFGIPTFTTGIFRAWFSLGDMDSAIRLSAILLIFVLLLLSIEKYNRRRSNFSNSSKNVKNIPPKQLYGKKAAIAFLVCFIPVLLGFLVPLFQLAYWASSGIDHAIDLSLIKTIFNSLFLAAGAGILCIAISILIIYTKRIFSSKVVNGLSALAVIGYAIPGAVIAIGVMIPFTRFNMFLNEVADQFLQLSFGLFFTTFFISLIFAYVVRFLAVAFNSIDSGFAKLNKNLDEASRIMGKGHFKSLFQINLPLVKTSIVAAAILVFVEVLKELPLTLILRPFNFDTLATITFELASDEKIIQSSWPALIIVMTGIIPIILLNRIMKTN